MAEGRGDRGQGDEGGSGRAEGCGRGLTGVGLDDIEDFAECLGGV